MKLGIGVLALWLAAAAPAQVPAFRNPLDIAMQLSANFGEIRSDHFHTGYDFRTGGKTGLPVYAAAAGHVSRIRVSATGYGRAVYVTHPNGFMTVYAHLDSFSSTLTAYVRSEQYRQQSFEVELYPESGRFAVQQGTLIGYSGNSGTSSGPHLHFEIRDASGESFPLNPAAFLPVPDSAPPTIHALYVFPEPSGCLPVEPLWFPAQQRNGRALLTPDSMTVDYPVIGLGLQVKDFYNGSSSDQGVYSLALEVDDLPVFGMKLDRLVFGNGRYVNAHIDYAAYKSSARVIQKLFREPGDRNTIYAHLHNDGRMDLSDRRWHRAVIRAADAAGNETTLTFRIRYSGKKPNTSTAETTNCAAFDREFRFHADSVRVTLPANALYRNSPVEVNQTAQRSAFGAHYAVGSRLVPLHHSLKVALLPARVLPEHQDKMLIALLNNGKPRALPSQWEGSWLTASARSFGTFAILADTSKPQIFPLNLRNNERLSGKYIHFTVRDELSGIASYSAWLNGKWVLMEYDPKADRMTVVLDESLSPGIYVLRLVVSDAVQNRNTYELSFLK